MRFRKLVLSKGHVRVLAAECHSVVIATPGENLVRLARRAVAKCITCSAFATASPYIPQDPSVVPGQRDHVRDEATK